MSESPRGVTEHREGSRVTWTVRRGWTESALLLVFASAFATLAALGSAVPDRWGSSNRQWRLDTARMALVTMAAVGGGLVIAQRRIEIVLEDRCLTSTGWLWMSKPILMVDVVDVSCECTTRNLKLETVTKARIRALGRRPPFSTDLLVTGDIEGAVWITGAIRQELGR